MCTLICPHNQTKRTPYCLCKICFITLPLLLQHESPRGSPVINANLSHGQITAGAELIVEGEWMEGAVSL